MEGIVCWSRSGGGLGDGVRLENNDSDEVSGDSETRGEEEERTWREVGGMEEREGGARG